MSKQFLIMVSLKESTNKKFSELSAENLTKEDKTAIYRKLDPMLKEEQGVTAGTVWTINYANIVATRDLIVKLVKEGNLPQAMQIIKRFADGATRAHLNRMRGGAMPTTFFKKIDRRDDGSFAISSRATIENFADWFNKSVQPRSARNAQGKMEIIDFTPTYGIEEFTPQQYRILETYFTEAVTSIAEKMKEEETKRAERHADAVASDGMFKAEGEELAKQRTILMGEEYKPPQSPAEAIPEPKKRVTKSVIKPVVPSASMNRFDLLSEEEPEFEEKPVAEIEIHVKKPTEKSVGQVELHIKKPEASNSVIQASPQTSLQTSPQAWAYIASLSKETKKEEQKKSPMQMLGQMQIKQ